VMIVMGVVLVVLLGLLVMSVNFWLVLDVSDWVPGVWLPRVVRIGEFTRLGVVVWPVVLWVLMALVIGVSMEDIRSVVELSVAASQDVCAGANHVAREGKLLAVKDEEILVFIEGVLSLSASSLQVGGLVPLSVDLVVDVIDPLRVPVDMVIVVFDAMVVVLDAVVNIVDVVCEVEQSLSHGFE